jgi:hypothetical protein
LGDDKDYETKKKKEFITIEKLIGPFPFFTFLGILLKIQKKREVQLRIDVDDNDDEIIKAKK